MKLNEAEMRMAYQIESTDPNAVLNEIYMTWRLSRNQTARDTAESLCGALCLSLAGITYASAQAMAGIMKIKNAENPDVPSKFSTFTRR